jgi:hypothetical protein
MPALARSFLAGLHCKRQNVSGMSGNHRSDFREYAQNFVSSRKRDSGLPGAALSERVDGRQKGSGGAMHAALPNVTEAFG